jgi:hypothetical protein
MFLLMQTCFGVIAGVAALGMIVGAINDVTGRAELMGYPPTTFMCFQIMAASLIVVLLCQILTELRKGNTRF